MRTFYKQVFTVGVLSEGPLDPDMDLDAIHYAITEGDCSGVVKTDGPIELTPSQAANELLRQGSSPDFFGLTETGAFVND